MYLLGIHNSQHDAAACLFDNYRLIAAVSLERLTRQKGAGVSAEQELPVAAIDECLAIAGISRADVGVVCSTRDHWEFQSYRLPLRLALKQRLCRPVGHKRLLRMTYLMTKLAVDNAIDIFDADGFKSRYGFHNAGVHFCNHHAAHGVPAYFYSEFDDALVYTADACGDNVAYSARVARHGEFDELFGGDVNLHRPFPPHSMGDFYAYFTEALGFLPNRHEGKLTGLAGFGDPEASDDILRHFRVDDDGEIRSDFASLSAMRDYAFATARGLTREDAAAAVQMVLEKLVCEAVGTLLRKTDRRSLAVAGGVFANVRLNRALLETTAAERIFIFPAMGDEGLPVGACLLYLHERDGAKTWHANRSPLRQLYVGRDYDGQFRTAAARHPELARAGDRAIGRTVDALVAGHVVAIYTGRMEYGPRALGARSILASPVRRDVNDTINKRLKRSEFMPFAPVVLSEHAAEVFDLDAGNLHAAQFMTITCDVRPEWRERIPAVVHVDGSARPQVIGPDINPLYRGILEAFHQATGLPVLVNTSFNVHEEPIVDRPEQALKSLLDGRVDAIVTGEGFYTAPARTALP